MNPPSDQTDCSDSSPTLSILEQYNQFIIPTYNRFPLVLARGQGSHVWDIDGHRYLDFTQGIAVNALGHAHPTIVRALTQQASTLVHISNLYHHPAQPQLAGKINKYFQASGKVFFCNSGAEANEALIKLSRRFGQPDGRHHIITAQFSFHGRTMGTISATGQDKVKEGFAPLLPHFTHVPFNDIKAIQAACTPQTVAILIEGIQGEGGVHVATPEYLLAVQRLCHERNLLLLWDGVQCGMFRTGAFQSYQRILSTDNSFIPDAVAMAKSLGGGFPIGAIWVRDPLHSLLPPGSHGTTYGGSPLACAAALAVFEVIESQNLCQNIRLQGDYLKNQIQALICRYPHVLSQVRGYGGLIGIELKNVEARPFAERLLRRGLLTTPAGKSVIRLLPPLNVSTEECDEALHILERTCLETDPDGGQCSSQ